jgi:hypothetical protein
MAEKNPDLEKLRQQFDLDLDYWEVLGFEI